MKPQREPKTSRKQTALIILAVIGAIVALEIIFPLAAQALGWGSVAGYAGPVGLAIVAALVAFALLAFKALKRRRRNKPND